MAHIHSSYLSTLRDYIWELKYAENTKKIVAIKRLSEVAYSIGLDTSAEDLIPIVQVLISQTNDTESLKALIEQLIKLAPFLCGSLDIHQLLPTFENLIKRDDEFIQNRTLDCMKLYAKDVNAAHFEIHFKTHLHRLSTDNCINTRRLVSGLYGAYYSRLPFALKEELLNDYALFCRDPVVRVRKSAALNLKEFSKVVDFERLRSVVIPQLFIPLTEDETDSVRVAAIDAFLGICVKLIPRNVEQLLMPVIMKLVDDKSFTVRLKIAYTIIELQKAVGPTMSKNYLISAVKKLFSDPVTDVRIAILNKIYEFCSNMELIVRESLIKSFILPQLEALYSDPSQKVRTAVCDLMKLATFLSLDSQKQYLVPAAMILLRDDCYTVRHAAASNLNCIKSAIDVPILSNSINAEILVAVKLNKFEKLLKNIDILPLYAIGLGEEFADEKILSTLIATETDHSSSLIKVEILNFIRKTSESLGQSWIEKLLLPQLNSLLSKNNSSWDQHCIYWTNAFLSGLPSSFAFDAVTNYLSELNKRNVDKSELRSIVFNAVKNGKRNTNEESLKRAIGKLETTVFIDDVDKEFLQLALNDNETSELVEEEKVSLLFVEPPKVDMNFESMQNVIRIKKERNLYDPEERMKRFSLPSTPLYDQASFFDFSLKPSSVANSPLLDVSPSTLQSRKWSAPYKRVTSFSEKNSVIETLSEQDLEKKSDNKSLESTFTSKYSESSLKHSKLEVNQDKTDKVYPEVELKSTDLCHQKSDSAVTSLETTTTCASDEVEKLSESEVQTITPIIIIEAVPDVQLSNNNIHTFESLNCQEFIDKPESNSKSLELEKFEEKRPESCIISQGNFNLDAPELNVKLLRIKSIDEDSTENLFQVHVDATESNDDFQNYYYDTMSRVDGQNAAILEFVNNIVNTAVEEVLNQSEDSKKVEGNQKEIDELSLDSQDKASEKSVGLISLDQAENQKKQTLLDSQLEVNNVQLDDLRMLEENVKFDEPSLEMLKSENEEIEKSKPHHESDENEPFEVIGEDEVHLVNKENHKSLVDKVGAEVTLNGKESKLSDLNLIELADENNHFLDIIGNHFQDSVGNSSLVDQQANFVYQQPGVVKDEANKDEPAPSYEESETVYDIKSSYDENIRFAKLIEVDDSPTDEKQFEDAKGTFKLSDEILELKATKFVIDFNDDEIAV